MPELVNQPFQVLQWWAQALMSCNCRKAEGMLALLVLTGVGNRTQCQHCKTSYFIKGFLPSEEGPVVIIESEKASGLVM